jgi:hypothetical protein
MPLEQILLFFWNKAMMGEKMDEPIIKKKRVKLGWLITGSIIFILGILGIMLFGGKYSVYRIYNEIYFGIKQLSWIYFLPYLFVILGAILIHISLLNMPLVSIVILLGLFLIFYAFFVPTTLVFGCPSQWYEAKRNLLYLNYYEKKYHKKNGHYSSSFKTLGWSPNEIKNYCYFLAEESPVNPSLDFKCELPPGIKPFVGKDKYLIVASGRVCGSPSLSVWTIDDSKRLRNVVNDKKE